MTTRLLTKIVVPATATLLVGLTSCTSPSKQRPTAGRALIDAVPGGEHHDRIKGVKLLSVNGTSASKKSAALPSGANFVKVRFDWPQGGSQAVSLKFRARPDQKYKVKYDPFPPTADQLRGTTELSAAAQTIADGSFEIMRSGHGNPAAALLGFAVLSPAIVLGTADHAYRIKESIRERHSPVHYVDLWVISEDPSEGVVRRVRAFPNGHLLSEKWWDNYHYSPGYHVRETLRAQKDKKPAGFIRYNPPEN